MIFLDFSRNYGKSALVWRDPFSTLIAASYSPFTASFSHPLRSLIHTQNSANPPTAIISEKMIHFWRLMDCP